MSAEKLIADVVRKHRIERCSVSSRTESHQWGKCPGCDFESYTFPIKGINWDLLAQEILADHVSAEIVKALGLTLEEQWVPVQADGDRWQPRDKPLALAALDLYKAGGPLDFDDTVPLTGIEHESRWVSGWSEVQP